MDSLGVGTLDQVVPVTCLLVQAGENPEAWVTIPDGETSSQTAVDLESSYWVLLDDLACGLTENAFVPVQSILVYRPDESSNAVVYVSFTNTESTLATLPLDYSLHSYLYTEITGVSSDLGLGNDLRTALPPPENLSSDPHLDAPTPVGSETDLLASNDDLATDANLTVDYTSDSLTSTSLDTGLTGNPTNSFDVDVASNPSDPNGLKVSACSSAGHGY